MTIDDAATRLAKLAFTTSDPGSACIYDLTKPVGWERFFLKEFIYLKAFLGIYICVKSANSNNISDVEHVKELMFEKLAVAFKHDIVGYGNNYPELIQRFKFYSNNVDLNDFNTIYAAYHKAVGLDALQIGAMGIFNYKLTIGNAIDAAHDWMLEEMQKAQSGSPFPWKKIVALIVVCIAVYYGCYSEPAGKKKYSYTKPSKVSTVKNTKTVAHVKSRQQEYNAMEKEIQKMIVDDKWKPDYQFSDYKMLDIYNQNQSLKPALIQLDITSILETKENAKLFFGKEQRLHNFSIEEDKENNVIVITYGFPDTIQRIAPGVVDYWYGMKAFAPSKNYSDFTFQPFCIFVHRVDRLKLGDFKNLETIFFDCKTAKVFSRNNGDNDFKKANFPTSYWNEFFKLYCDFK